MPVGDKVSAEVLLLEVFTLDVDLDTGVWAQCVTSTNVLSATTLVVLSVFLSPKLALHNSKPSREPSVTVCPMKSLLLVESLLQPSGDPVPGLTHHSISALNPKKSWSKPRPVNFQPKDSPLP